MMCSLYVHEENAIKPNKISKQVTKDTDSTCDSHNHLQIRLPLRSCTVYSSNTHHLRFGGGGGGKDYGGGVDDLYIDLWLTSPQVKSVCKGLPVIVIPNLDNLHRFPVQH